VTNRLNSLFSLVYFILHLLVSSPSRYGSKKENKEDVSVINFEIPPNYKEEDEKDVILKKGKGISEKDGLWDNQIEEYMKQFKNHGWKGVYSINELDKIPVSKKMSFIMNLSPSNKPGTHWVAVYIDTKNDMDIEYFDSFGRDPPKEFLEGIKSIINKLNPKVYLKLKINKIVDQRANSSTCGYHAMNFLLNRYKGTPFKDCSGYSNVVKGENDAHKLENKIKKFGYI
jgi:hypothetical protein